ncbi:MAG TPA: molybdopterin-dependent oxidoreductase [Gemmatimonadales bacterium]|jgi:DMSO/TMAO reductase YedYZ molybdopterin-dependent catalytic subunit|nr:molybdopterin-dependent oxidoreductase [Gemmatimonadales bacterium]
MTEPGARITRRDLLRLAVAGGPAALAACGWDGGPLIQPKLLRVSRLNDWVGEQVLFSQDRLAPTYRADQRSGRMPSYFISRGGPPVWPEGTEWALSVGGLVRKPMRLTRPMLEALPRLTYTVKHHCVEGWTAVATWTGVPVRAVADLVQPTDQARFIRFDSFDAGFFNGWDLASAFHPQTILGYAFNDRPIGPDHGAPLRLYSPVKLGYKLTKYLTAMTFTRERPGGYWEDQGYPWFAGI